jgi:hypothetical protein
MSDATTKRSLKLKDNGDWDTTTGTLQYVTGLAAVRQAVRIRLQAFLGEWFLDTTVGTPLLQQVLGQKNPNPAVLHGVFRARILGTPGVAALQKLELTFDRRARTLRVDFVASCDFGEFADSVPLAA